MEAMHTGLEIRSKITTIKMYGGVMDRVLIKEGVWQQWKPKLSTAS